MKALRRIVVEEAVIGAVFLTSAWYLYYFVSIWGLLDHLRESPFRDYVTGPGVHVEMLVSGVGLGFLLAVVNFLTEGPRLRQRSLGQIILLKSGLYAGSILLVMMAIQAIFLLFIYSLEEMKEIWQLLSLRIFFSIMGWLLASILALTFLLEVRRKVGPENFISLLTGKYHRPREEDRVFLFLDLKGSTAIAERLGHARYSQFIRHCYHDLTDAVLDFQAQIYQFVGDEVVLTWPSASIDAGKRSLDTFFAFGRRLHERRGWYEGTFGAAPEFRGGAEKGMVTVTEVGDIKREIAFHGDALNTAARLVELSRKFDQPLMVSGKIRETLQSESRLALQRRGEITLRGKAEAVEVYGIDWPETPAPTRGVGAAP